MRATGDNVIFHPAGDAAGGTESDQVVVVRRPTRSVGDVTTCLTGDAAGRKDSEQLVVLRPPHGSFCHAVPYRRKVRYKIFKAIFKPNSSGGIGGRGASDPVAIRLPNGSSSDPALCCGKIFAYLLKREPKN